MNEYLAKKVRVPNGTIACFLRPPSVRFKENGVLITRKLGELHFVSDEFGAGLVAHEIQHFLSFWIMWMEWGEGLLDKYCEPISDMAETLTKQFWNEVL
ncbi:hypothetical protein LCGC14_2445870 [marine sediment metagenome]|uniref:Uncharacterized protein n=1 Tax=marine sediment metagenome TaxID=412755 RepID=A0A0F9BHQ8_9ZZZZ